MRKIRLQKEQEGADGDAFTLSISDLMAGLLAIFILALSYFMLNLGEQQFTTF